MSPWDAGHRLLFRILQDVLGLDLEQKVLLFQMANCIYLHYDMILISSIIIVMFWVLIKCQLTAHKASVLNGLKLRL